MTKHKWVNRKTTVKFGNNTKRVAEWIECEHCGVHRIGYVEGDKCVKVLKPVE